MKFSKKQIKLFNKLEEYYKKLDEAISPRKKDCGTCIDCCAYLVSTVHSPLEIDYARYYLEKHGNPGKLPVLSWEDYLKKSAGLCIYIDPGKKSCMLYHARFNICRVYGPYIPDTDITMYGKCVYKGLSIPRCYENNLVPYEDEFKDLVRQYIDLLSPAIKKTYEDITASGETPAERLRYSAERYEKLIEKYSSLWDLYYWIGKVYVALGRFEEGLMAFQKSISLNPEQIESYLDVGLFCYRTGDIKRAEYFFRKALTICSEDSMSAYLIVLSYIKQGKLKEGTEEFATLLDRSFKYEEKMMLEKEHIDFFIM